MNMLQKLSRFLGASLVAGALLTPALTQAQVTVAGNMSNSSDFDSGSATFVDWFNIAPGNSTGTARAVSFSVSGSDYTLSSVTVPLDLFGTINLSISIVNNSGGAPNLASVVELLATNPGNVTGTPTGLTYTSSSNPTLTQGTTYWLVLAPANENTANTANDGSVGWYWNTANDNTGIRSDRTFTTSAWGSWSAGGVDPAFSVSGVAVPEPGTYAAIAALGLLGFAVYRRRVMA